MHYPFHLIRATQALARLRVYLRRLSTSYYLYGDWRSLNLQGLLTVDWFLKFLYVVDREALMRGLDVITGGPYVATHSGPIPLLAKDFVTESSCFLPERDGVVPIDGLLSHG